MHHATVSNAYRSCTAVLWFACSTATAAANTQLAARDLVDLSLEQLSDIVVSSVSKQDEPLARAAASIFVISADDIRRAGATSLPEALQLVPNLDVARANANQYAISARGFNNILANKLLVLIDGRTIYTPLFSGTFWEAQDILLEDVERIEVISGPGATLWGANAVNGVINVIMRPASATQGGLLATRAGDAQYDGAVRYGGTRSDGHYRVYGKTVSRNNTTLTNGNPVGDDADHGQVGFRSDWDRSGDSYTIQGDAYHSDIDGQGREFSGFNLLGRWTRHLPEGAQLKIQAYFNRDFRDHANTFEERLDTYDVELQHALKPHGQHRLLWGLGIRHHDDEVENSPAIVFLPPERGIDRNQVFMQDQIALRPDLELTLGIKAEINTYTDTEFLPNARLGWTPAEGHFLWSALSRAVRAPSRVDRELSVPGVVAGGSNFTSEVIKVFELGYRAQPLAQLSYSITGFYHQLENLRTLEPSPTDPQVANDREGHVQGIEGWGAWQSGEGWRLSAGFVRQQKILRLRPGAVDLQTPSAEGNDPDTWYKLRVAFDIGRHRELDVMLRHYGQRPDPQVPSYTTVDMRLGWGMARDAELSVLAQNLLNRRHPEWGVATNRAELERAVFVKLRLDFDAQ